jgi:hypothetical protein
MQVARLEAPDQNHPTEDELDLTGPNGPDHEFVVD